MEYKDVFEAIRTFPGDTYYIQLTPDAVPVKHAPGNIPVHLCDTLKKELDDMVKLRIIRCVLGGSIPTPCVNSFVVN